MEKIAAEEQETYISFLLRLWQLDNEGESLWRASLENPHTGERQGFANLKELFIFLETQTGETVLGNVELSPQDDRRGNDDSFEPSLT